MFDVGGPEFLFLLVLALLVFGPRRLPKIGRQLGTYVGQMRRSMADFRGHLEREVAYEEMRDVAEGLKDVRQTARDAAQGLADPQPRPRSSTGKPQAGNAAPDDSAAEADPGPARSGEAEAAYRPNGPPAGEGAAENGGEAPGETTTPAEDRDQR